VTVGPAAMQQWQLLQEGGGQCPGGVTLGNSWSSGSKAFPDVLVSACCAFKQVPD